jgi:GNAT superfamily N-acetyltransferase
MRVSHAGFELDDAPDRIDLDALWAFLSTEAYWGRWRSRADVERQLAAAWRVVGAYQARTGEMVGFARAISDGVSFGYLADVYVAGPARGCGLGKRLVATMVDTGPGAGFRWALHTADAHGLYRQFGFTEPDHTFLERRPASGPGATPR